MHNHKHIKGMDNTEYTHFCKVHILSHDLSSNEELLKAMRVAVARHVMTS